MHKILILSYYFPPNAGAHVLRIAKFTKYLTEFNYQPIILTNKKKTKRQDNSLANDIKDEKIYYSRDIGKTIPGDIRKLFPRFSVPDKLITWRFTVIKEALKIIKKEDVKLIFVSNPPHSIGYIGSIIAKKTKLPFILDFRDEWITFPLFNNKKHKQLQKEMYREMISNCDGLTFVTKTFQNRILENLGNTLDIDTEVIYNGYDESDLPSETDSKRRRKIRICYNGRFKKVSDPTIFFKIFCELIENRKIDPKQFEFVFTGDKKTNKKWLQDFPEINNITRLTGFLSLKKTYKLIATMDIGLILLTNYKDSSTFPLKLFDYMALEKPIIAFLEKKDELSDLISDYGSSCIITKKTSNYKERIINFLEKVKNEQVKINHGLRQKFTRKKQTESLAKFINKRINKKS